MEALTPWLFLTLLSASFCFAVALLGGELARFNADRPWQSKAIDAERREVDLTERNRALQNTLTSVQRDADRLQQSVERSTALVQSLSADIGASRESGAEFRRRAEVAEAKLRAAEEWLDKKGKRIELTLPAHAQIVDK